MIVPALSIGELARRTGVREETLRVWERRYGLPRPARTSGGHRRYPESDVALVREMRRLIAAGWATGSAARRVLEAGVANVNDSPATEGSPSGADLPAATDRVAMNRAASTTELMGQRGLHSEPEPTSRPGASSRAGPSSRAEAAAASGVRQTALATRASGPPDRPPDRPPQRPGDREVDIQALEATYRAARRLLRMRAPGAAGVIFADLVEELGGTTVPARLAGRDALPLDLSFGEGEPILPVAEPFSLARLRMEAILPSLVEDIRALVDLLRVDEPAQEGD